MIKSTKTLTYHGDHEGYHPTTLGSNAAFLELISEVAPAEAKVLLEEWAIYCIGSHWGGSALNPLNYHAVLTALVFFISSKFQVIMKMQEESIRGFGDATSHLMNSEQVLRKVHQIRNKIHQTLVKAVLGRKLTDEEGLILLMDNTLPLFISYTT